jgi:hypothetical protein
MHWHSRGYMRARTCVIAITGLVLSACSSGPTDLVLSTDDPSLSIPAEAARRRADITGVVTDVVGSRIRDTFGFVRVEARPGLASGGQKAQVRLATTTRVYRLVRGRLVRATFGDIAVRQVGHVWFDGPVAESYPVQGTALVYVIGE